MIIRVAEVQRLPGRLETDTVFEEVREVVNVFSVSQIDKQIAQLQAQIDALKAKKSSALTVKEELDAKI